jgi:hypothetical protein
MFWGNTFPSSRLKRKPSKVTSRLAYSPNLEEEHLLTSTTLYSITTYKSVLSIVSAVGTSIQKENPVFHPGYGCFMFFNLLT